MSLRPGVRLGVDWGDARIGVAACDRAAMLAYPIRTVQVRGDEGAAIAEILDIAEEYGPILEVVLGLPRTLKGKEGPAAQKMRQRAATLRRRLDPGTDLRLVDERMTTAAAARGLQAAGRNTRNQRAVIDQAAAVAILEHALSVERSTGAPAGELVEPTDQEDPR
ncbi:putative holliday junction resolvase [Raineyella antarctica]|uniref:Putative pre-16S rRNA nuclease n=1 Tax=Raineyella antarctica TaxID=1577474 RepID=A0A1G6HIR0_9ACTN|nr:Holliday junction resolvase RuvX [Raineyella antarctica]SDB94132.1 putative holliday junction resolvase [Raineyella antarctica]